MATNKWVPLSKIAHGIAIATFTTNSVTSSSTLSSPLLRPIAVNSNTQLPATDSSMLTAKRLSTSSSDFSSSSSWCGDHTYLTALEVGDEVYIFEQQGGWYRGYVISSFEDNTMPPIGIFPKSHVQVMEYVDLDSNSSNISLIQQHKSGSANGEDDLLSMTSSPPFDMGSNEVSSPSFPFPLTGSPTGSQYDSQLVSTLAPTSNPFTKPKKRDKPTRGYCSCPTSGIDFDTNNLSSASGYIRSKSIATATTLSPSSSPSPTSSIGDDEEQQKQQKRPSPPPLPMTRFEQATITGWDEPLVDEIAACIREWNYLLYNYLENNQYGSFNLVCDYINCLYQSRRQLLDQVLSKDEISKLKKDIIRRMALINISQNREMILRHPEHGYILDIDSTSVSALYYMHWKYTISGQTPISSLSSLYSNPSSSSKISNTELSSISSQAHVFDQQETSAGYASSLFDQQQRQQQQQKQQNTGKRKPYYHYKGGEFHHLLFDLKACMAQISQPGEWTELQFSLYSDSQGKFVTEQFVVHLNYYGTPKGVDQMGKLQTLFLDLANQDLNDSLYLVCYIYRLGAMKCVDKEKDHTSLGNHASSVFNVHHLDHKGHSIFGGHLHHHHHHNDKQDTKEHGSGYFSNGNGSHQRQSNTSCTHGSASLPSQAHTNLFRRPFGCAVLNVGRLLQQVDQINSGTHTMGNNQKKNEVMASGSRSAPLYPDGDKKKQYSPNIPSGSKSSGANTSNSAPNISGNSSSTMQNSGNGSKNTSAWHYHIAPEEHNMRIYTATSASSFSYLHQHIIRGNTKEYTHSPRADTLCVILRMFFGQKSEVLKVNADVLFDTPLTARIGFPDVVFPDDERNELYITLNSGDFAHFGRTRNIQVIICARDNQTGDIVEMAVSVGSGTPPTSTWESAVYYHEMKPIWNERVKVKIQDVNIWQRSHIFLVVKHRSRHGGGPRSMNEAIKSPGHDGDATRTTSAWKRLTVESNTSSSDKILAMGYIPLFIPPLSHDFVADGTHTLCLYKYDKHLLNPSSYFGVVPWCSQTTTPSNMQGQENMLATILQANRQYRMSVQHPSNSSHSSLKSGAGCAGGHSIRTMPFFHHSGSHHTFMSDMGLQHNQHQSYLSANSQGTSANGRNNSSANPHSIYSVPGGDSYGRPHAIRDSLVVSTLLCSTRFTQNTALVQLINWRSIVEDSDGKLTTTAATNCEGVTELLSMLDKFTFVGEQEVVKFLADIFDALLDILVFRVPDSLEKQNALQDQVIVAIIWVLSIVQDRRFSNFRPVLTVYINQRFYCLDGGDDDYDDDDDDDNSHRVLEKTDEMINNVNLHGTPTSRTPAEYKCVDDSIYKRDADAHGTYQLYTSYRYRLKHGKRHRRRMSLAETTYNQLLKGIIRLSTNPSDITKAKTLRSSIKVWEYLFRFIEQSREMQRKSEDQNDRNIREQAYKEDLREFFDLATQMMHPDQPSSMIGTQTLVLQYFCEAITDVKNAFSAEEIVDIITTMMDTCSHFTGKLVGFKLNMILAFIKAPIFGDKTCCREIGKQVMVWIRPWLNSYMAVAKEVIFSRTTMENSVNQHSDDGQQQTRLLRAQWIENLRLSLTIVHGILEKIRNVRGMSLSGLSAAAMVMSSSSVVASGTPISAKAAPRMRPVSQSTLGDDDYTTVDSTNHDEAEFTTASDDDGLDGLTSALIQLVPQMLHTYKDLQRLASQAIQATTAPASSSSANATNSTPLPINMPLAKKDTFDSMAPLNTSNPTKVNQRHSLTVFRDRSNSTRLLPQMQEHGGNNNVHTSPTDHSRTATSSGSFPMVLRALATSPTEPFPSVYPFQTNASHEIAELVGVDLMALVTSGLMDLTVLLLDLFHLTPHSQWLAHLKNMALNKDRSTLPNGDTGPEATADYICTLCYVCTAILFGDDIQKLADIQGTLKGYDAFLDDPTRERRKWPKEWLNLDVVAHKVILTDILAPITELLDLDLFLPKKQPHQQQQQSYSDDNRVSPTCVSGTLVSESGNNDKMVRLWRTVFMTEVRVLASPSLEVEDMLPQAQRAVWQLAGNIRGDEGTQSLRQLWDLTGPRTRADQSRRRRNRLWQETKDLKMKPQLLDYFDLRNRSLTDTDIDDGDSKLDLYSDNEDNGAQDKGSSKLLPEDVTQIHLELMPVLLKPLCSASLTLNDKLRRTTIGMIADLLAIHIPITSGGDTGQNLMIGTIDKLVMTLGKGNDKIRVKWVAELQHAIKERLTTEEDQEWGKTVVDSLANLMELLLQIRSLPADNVEFMDERINATLKLMKFIQVFERQEIYIKYVHQLVDLHLHNSNFVEAALTLRFHADLVQWDPYTEVDAIPELGYGVESAFARKRGLYNTMMAYLNKGAAWELCADLCNELYDQFATFVVDYKECGDILRQKATFMEDIVTKERYYSEYFRVGFYGRGFPASLRNQHFIYRGMAWEKMPSFVERMQNRHPNAQLLSGKMATSPLLPDEYIRELEAGLDGQYMQITAVTPVLDTYANPALRSPLLPDMVKKYYQSNMVNQFTYSRPVTKETDTEGSTFRDGNNGTWDKTTGADDQLDNSVEPPTLSKQELDFLNLWTEKTTFTSEDAFPTITLRSKILSIELREISPIENAVDAMNSKTNELTSLEKTYSAYVSNPQVAYNLNPFSMSLNGAVDAPVNGGVPLYKKTFLSPYYWQKHPDMHSWVERLKEAIDKQVVVIDRCLDTHEKLVRSEMRPFHDNLVKLYKKNFENDIHQLERRGTTLTTASNTGTVSKEKGNVANKRKKGSNKTNPYPPQRLSLTTSPSRPTFPPTNQSNHGSGSFSKDMERLSIMKSKTISPSIQQQNRESFSSPGGSASSQGSTGNWPSILTQTKSATYSSLPSLLDDQPQQSKFKTSRSNGKDRQSSLPSNRNSDGNNDTSNNSDPNQSHKRRPTSGDPSPKDRPHSLKFDESIETGATKGGLSRALRMSLRKATRRSTFSSGTTNR